MKKLDGLNKQLTKPNNRPAAEMVPTYADIIADSLSHMPAKGIDSIHNWKLALKLAELKEPFAVEDAEFERLRESVTTNPCGYLSWAHAQALMKVMEWNKSKPNELEQ